MPFSDKLAHDPRQSEGPRVQQKVGLESSFTAYHCETLDLEMLQDSSPQTLYALHPNPQKCFLVDSLSG